MLTTAGATLAAAVLIRSNGSPSPTAAALPFAPARLEAEGSPVIKLNSSTATTALRMDETSEICNVDQPFLLLLPCQR
ncbi:hypothetical protein D3C73_1198310 [compost metagenome]